MSKLIRVAIAFGCVGFVIACVGGGGPLPDQSGTGSTTDKQGSSSESSGSKSEGNGNSGDQDVGNVTTDPAPPADASSPKPQTKCTPGAFVFCDCGGKQQGTARCKNDGSGLEGCECVDGG